ncbi:MAG: flavodoxin family protein, partial [Ruminococcaceae bacterium]|nr:flavodoxin family protein [Oscillospiraceae bacterium]
MKKVLMINGSPNEFGCTYTALSEVKSELAKNGVGSEIIYLGKKPIAGCIACGECRKTGKCVFNDKVNELLPRLEAGEFGAMVLGSPVYFAGPSGQLCSFLERLFYCRGTKLNGML